MKIDYNHKTVKIHVSDDGTQGRIVQTLIDGAWNPVELHCPRTLPLHFSLSGEVEPTLAPLSVDYSVIGETSYRYDWVVGVGPADWDYLSEMRRKRRAVVVQLLVDSGVGGFTFTDSSPVLAGLTPSLKTSSWFDDHADAIRESVRSVAELAKPYLPIVPGVVQGAANFIGSKGDADVKNWYMYRFFSGDQHCCAIEWNINKNVLIEYGPLLRGSIVLTFHGRAKVSGAGIRLLLRARLGFDQKNEINDLPPWEELEQGAPVQLFVRPQLVS